MKKTFLFLVFSFLILQFVFAQRVSVALLSENETGDQNAETISVISFLKEQRNINLSILPVNNIRDEKQLGKYDVLWFHRSDTTDFPESLTNEKVKDAILKFVENGGGLLLSLDAFRYINFLGIEPNKPEIIKKEAKDSGYGRLLGFHSFRSHPVFKGLNGGAYILKPTQDITVRNIGYYGDELPANGKVVATDWDYIFLRENKKLIVEYDYGKGKILAVGGYMYFKYNSASPISNVNRQHLEKFTLNCINYLANKSDTTKMFYWNYGESEVEPYNFSISPEIEKPIKLTPSHPWEIQESSMALSRSYATENYWDVAGQRLLVMGKEKGGIEEIWAHPFMALRDYEAGIKLSHKDTIYWFNDEEPEIEVRPESFTRFYRYKNASVKEIITTSIEEPQAVIHYEYSGVYPASLYIKFKSNLRLMWPYSEHVLKNLLYKWNENLNAFFVSDLSEDFVCILGSNKKPSPIYVRTNLNSILPVTNEINCLSGRFENFEQADSVFIGLPTDKLQVATLFKIELEMNDNFDIVVAAGNEGINKAVSSYISALENPARIFKNTTEYTKDFFEKILKIATPDNEFNEAYRWALIGADRFFVNTPGIGKSLVAGYAPTTSGWQGGHDIDGRPGYSWYFGRDAEWSGFALLDYGDFEKVKSVLEILQKYQDLNGKIFHELTTSGFIHYDASDATPLYIVLAGKYLKHSGDLNFIRQSWPHIKAAVDFCYSTDTDNDLLIENTNVGHGWVEGGGLFGSHTSLYLASCWAAALEEASGIAHYLGKNSESEKYKKDAEIVKNKINKLYWNEAENFYYLGLKKDGSFIEEKTIMPAIPVLFGQVADKRSDKVLESFAANEFTADWGVRIVDENSKLFNPEGYHTGSVWPLFTGWTALAEYESGRPVQGFSHVLNNLLVYRNWALGFVEEVLNGMEYKPSGVCRHQCWSETMALQPAIEGMLGIEPDAMKNRLVFSPSFPANWDSIKVENIRIGEHFLDFEMKRSDNKTLYFFRHQGHVPLNIKFCPAFPQGTIFKKLHLNGTSNTILTEQGSNNQMLVISFDIKDTTEISVISKNGIEIIPVVNHPKPGEKSKGFRIISNKLEGNKYILLLQGLSGEQEEFDVYINNQKIKEIKNAVLDSQDGKIFKFKIDFPEVDSKYAKVFVEIFLN